MIPWRKICGSYHWFRENGYYRIRPTLGIYKPAVYSVRWSACTYELGVPHKVHGIVNLGAGLSWEEAEASVIEMEQ